MVVIGYNLIEQLAALNGSEWSVAGILNEVLPEQRNLWEARCLLKPVSYERNTPDSKKRIVASIHDTRFKRSGSVAPIPVAASNTFALANPFSKQPVLTADTDNQPSLGTIGNNYRGHILTLWEDKFRRKCLAVEDVLFLLARPNVACTLESASFLRATQMSYDQVIELEMALAMLREQGGGAILILITLKRLLSRCVIDLHRIYGFTVERCQFRGLAAACSPR